MIAIIPSPLMPKEDDSKDQIEKIYVCDEKICKFPDNTRKAIAKIGKMCTETIQKEFSQLRHQGNELLGSFGTT